jgi:hypothetical protein
LPAASFSGGVTLKRAYWSPTAVKLSDAGALAFQLRGASRPTLTLPGCVA